MRRYCCRQGIGRRSRSARPGRCCRRLRAPAGNDVDPDVGLYSPILAVSCVRAGIGAGAVTPGANENASAGIGPGAASGMGAGVGRGVKPGAGAWVGPGVGIGVASCAGAGVGPGVGAGEVDAIIGVGVGPPAVAKAVLVSGVCCCRHRGPCACGRSRRPWKSERRRRVCHGRWRRSWRGRLRRAQESVSASAPVWMLASVLAPAPVHVSGLASVSASGAAAVPVRVSGFPVWGGAPASVSTSGLLLSAPQRPCLNTTRVERMSGT